MKKNKVKLRSEIFLLFALLLVVSGLSYLIFVPQFGYFNDDWYLMYAAGAKGASVFREIFSIDRPGRVLVMMPAYWLFGQNHLYYNVSAYFFRFMSAVGFYWVLDFLWPRRYTATASMALLFLIYPGFLSQPNAIDYQSHIVGLAAAMLSIACTLKAILSDRKLQRILFFSIAIILGWLYLLQMEWFIGFEFLRWASIFVLISRSGGTLMQKVWRTLRSAYSTILVPAIFLLWRLVLFTPERGATDVSLQLDQLTQFPLKTSMRWLSTLLIDSFDVVVLAWGQPLSFLYSWIWTKKLMLLGLGVGAVSVAFMLIFLKQVEDLKEGYEGNWKIEAFWLGLSSAIFGLLPIIMVNRSVNFTFYSRYTLVSSAGAAILLGALIFSLKPTLLPKVIIAVLIFIASLTHFANSQRAVQLTQATRDFWWQVSWRIPHLENHTTLVANYAVGFSEEDYFVWGPANLIYFPESSRDEYIQPGVFAALLNQDTVDKTLRNEGQEFDNRRTIRTYKNYRKLLILTQPTANSCVHVIDGEQPEYSRGENASIQIIGPYSNLELILTNKPAPTPPLIIFGPEPEHTWCYFYQKATLALQRGDFDEILSLGEEAASKNLMPEDLIEWMPFLQAFAQQGEVERLKELAPSIVADWYVAQQACRILDGLQDLTQPVVNVIDLQYCIE